MGLKALGRGTTNTSRIHRIRRPDFVRQRDRLTQVYPSRPLRSPGWLAGESLNPGRRDLVGRGIPDNSSLDERD